MVELRLLPLLLLQLVHLPLLWWRQLWLLSSHRGQWRQQQLQPRQQPWQQRSLQGAL